MLSTLVEGEAVLLNLDTGEYYGLNETGTRVWELVTARRSEAEIVESLVSEYDGDRAAMAADVAHLVSMLYTTGMLDPDPPEGDGGR